MGKATFTAPESIPVLSDEAEVAVFRAVQEALSNVARHAERAPVRVEVTTPPGHLQLVIADEGPGFDGSFYRVTFGPKYFFTPNLYTRVAVAADYYEGKTAGGALPFDDGQRDHQELAVFDLVWTF